MVIYEIIIRSHIGTRKALPNHLLPGYDLRKTLRDTSVQGLPQGLLLAGCD